MTKDIHVPGKYYITDGNPHQIVMAALAMWIDEDDFLEHMCRAHFAVTTDGYDDVLLGQMYTVIETYLAKWRLTALNDHWTTRYGSPGAVTSQQAAKYALPLETHQALYAIMNHRHVPRVFAHLVNMAWVLNEIDQFHDIISHGGLWLDHSQLVNVLYKGVETTPDAQ